MADSDAPTTPEATAPTEDTPPATGQETAQNTQDDRPVDWEARYKNLHGEFTRKAQRLAELEDENAELRSFTPDDEEPEDDSNDDEPAPRQRKQPRESAAAAEWRARYEQEAWARAEAIYGQDVIQAYGTTARMLSRAETPADYITALEAYHQARSAGATPTQAAAQGGEPTPQAEPIRSDPNRPDTNPAPSVDPTQFAGGQNGGLMGLMRARAEAAIRR